MFDRHVSALFNFIAPRDKPNSSLKFRTASPIVQSEAHSNDCPVWNEDDEKGGGQFLFKILSPDTPPPPVTSEVLEVSSLLEVSSIS
jgi:hypothetical protein